MSTLTDLYAALSGDVAEVQAVTDAQAVLTAATDEKNTADALVTTTLADLTAAQDAQQAAIEGGGDGVAEQPAVDAAQAAYDAAVADQTTKTTALTDAQAAYDAAVGSVDVGDSVALAAKLPITDFGMVSNDMARAIITARGDEVKFEEPEDVASDYNMNPYV